MINYTYKSETGTEAKITKVSIGEDIETTFEIELLDGATYKGMTATSISENDFHKDFNLFSFNYNFEDSLIEGQ